MEKIKSLIKKVRNAKGIENLDKFLDVEDAKALSTLLDEVEKLINKLKNYEREN